MKKMGNDVGNENKNGMDREQGGTSEQEKANPVIGGVQ